MKQHRNANSSNQSNKTAKITDSHDERPDWHPYKVWQQQIKTKNSQSNEVEETAANPTVSPAVRLNPGETGAWEQPQFQATGIE